MRGRVSQVEMFDWARPTVAEAAGERLRVYDHGGTLSASAYPLPESEKQGVDGIVPAGGIQLVLATDCGVRAGDRVRRLGAVEEAYEITEVRAFPGHVEADARLCGVLCAAEEAGLNDA